RAEEILPGEHPVAEEGEPGGPLYRDQLLEVAPLLLRDRFRGGTAPLEVPRRLDEGFRARVDPRCEGLHWPATEILFSACRRRCSMCQRSISSSPPSARSSAARASSDSRRASSMSMSSARTASS